jgi:DNA-binding response OmpR family regulator
MQHYKPDHGEIMSILKLLISRAAQENIPINVISRILGYSRTKLTQYLQNEVDEGRLPHIPPDDWPHLCGISQDLPSNELIFYGHHNRDVTDACAEFDLTVGEGCLLMCLVKRAGQFCSVEMLLGATARNPEKVSGNLIQTHACRLRRKMKPFRVMFVMKRWCGYMMPACVAHIVISRIVARREANMDRAA